MGEPLRVMTWNVFHCRDGRGVPGATWRSILTGEPEEADGYVHLNRALVRETAHLIARARPDLCMLQEVPPVAVPELARGAGMRLAWSALTAPVIGSPWLRGRLGRANPDLFRTHAGNANVILVGRRLRPLRGSARAVRLNPLRRVLRDGPRLGLGWDGTLQWASEARRALAGRVVLPGGTALTAVCVHLHNARVPEQSLIEARALAHALHGVDGPLVVAGDLNVPPGHPALAPLTALGLADPSDDPRMGIDRILTRGLEVVSASRRWEPAQRDLLVRVRDRPRRLRVSDHDPVEAVVAEPARGS